MYKSTTKSIIMDKERSSQTIFIFIVSNEFKYPAKQRLAGAAKIVRVGTAGSGMDLITNIL